MQTLCRDCYAHGADRGSTERCPSCGSPRLIRHAELGALHIAHLDCDAFYAAVEKRDHPEWRHLPVIVGGGRRGVVTTCCYVARQFGVHSAMPMFKALAKCPDAIVVRPRMELYRDIGRGIRARMQALTPLVEPLSVDEAFLDLAGTEKLHGSTPAETLVRLARSIEEEFGITVSIGLSYNKSLAKLASAIDKPRGFAVIGHEDADAFLLNCGIEDLFGVGASLAAKLRRAGLTSIADLRAASPDFLTREFGAMGSRLSDLAHGRDHRPIRPQREAKSISSERTFESDLSDPDALAARLWPLCRSVSKRLIESELGAASVTLKLKDHRFKQITRAAPLHPPTQLAPVLFETGRQLLNTAIRERSDARFRLIGIGCSKFVSGNEADPPTLLDRRRDKLQKLEQAISTLEKRHGAAIVDRGIGLRTKTAQD